MFLALGLVACSPEAGLARAQPELVAEPASFAFDEVVVGTRSELGLLLRNAGTGRLDIDAAALLDGSSGDFELVSWPAELGAGDEGHLVARYTPDVEGEDFGSVELATNQDDAPLFEIALNGMGVIPRIDVDPELLYFGVVEPGAEVSASFEITAAGSGNLRISDIAFAGDEAAAYRFTLPDDWATPYVVTRGFSFTVEVTFAPPDASEYRGELWISSNDPEEPIASVHLYGNTTEDPTEKQAPTVEILDPNNGEYFLSDESVAFEGVVYDPNESASNLTCGWYANGSAVASGLPDGSGRLAASALLPVGEVDVALRCFDSDGMMGQDLATVTVWDREEPVLYTISGGSSVFDYFGVDDDVTISLDGTTIYSDANLTKDNLPPFSFEAKAGGVLRIVATDQNYCTKMIDGLVLHWGTGSSQALNDGECDSACTTDGCYSGGYDGPWPNVFLDASYTIAIP